MKKRNRILYSLASAAIIAAIGTTVSWQISNAADADARIIHPVAGSYNESPEPIYKANSEPSAVGDIKLLSRAEIDTIAFKDPEGKYISTTLTDWATATGAKADASDTASAKQRPFKFYDVDDARQVYVVETYYPDGLQTKGGLIKKCLDKAIYDAKTGKLFAVLHHGLQPGEKEPIANE